MKKGILFKVLSPDYYLEVGFTSDSFYIARNNKKLEMPIEADKQSGYAMCSASWLPTELRLMVLDKSYGEAVDSGADAIAEINSRTNVLHTRPTFPPNSLMTWARKQAIVPPAKSALVNILLWMKQTMPSRTITRPRQDIKEMCDKWGP